MTTVELGDNVVCGNISGQSSKVTIDHDLYLLGNIIFGIDADIGDVLTYNGDIWTALPANVASNVTLSSAGGTETLVATGIGAFLETKGLTAGTGISLSSDMSSVTIATTGAPPTGSAGGDLSGTYPNPTVAAGAIGDTKLATNAVTTTKITDANVTNAKLANPSLTVTAGTGLSGGGLVALGGSVSLNLPNVGTSSTFGSATQVPVFSTDAQGRVTTVTNTTISGTSPGGSAGGDLSGTYPNPTVAAGAIGDTKLATNAVTTTKITDANVTNAKLANPSLTVTAGTGLSGGGLVALGGSVSLNLPNVGTSSTFGSATQVPVFSTDAQGRVTTVTNTTISGTSPGGSAGGDLTGTYPNPTVAIAAITDTKLAANAVTTTKITDANVTNAKLANSSLTVTAGTGLSGGGLVALGGSVSLNLPNVGTSSTFGSATQVPVFSTDAQGRVTTVTNTTISGTSPGGSAGGDLTGTYPNPTVATGAITDTKLASNAVTTTKILDANVTNAKLANSSLTVTAGTGLSGGGLVALGGSTSLNLPSLITGGTYGSATQVPVFTADAQGRITAVTNTTITGASPSGSAGGDLSGTYPNPTVASVQTVSIRANATNRNLSWGASTNNPATGGTDNIAFGPGALTNGANTVTKTIAIGTNAAAALTGFTYNIVIGNAAMEFATGGDHNIAIGAKSLRNAKSCSKNICIGYKSGMLLADPLYGPPYTKDKHIIIGYRAGYNAKYGTTESSVIIGYGAGLNSIPTDGIHIGRFANGLDNSVAIGGLAVASSSAVAVGRSANAGQPLSIAIGVNSYASTGISVGPTAVTTSGISIGPTTSSASSSIAIGSSATASGSNTTCIGTSVVSSQTGSFNTRMRWGTSGIGLRAVTINSNPPTVGPSIGVTGTNQPIEIVIDTSSALFKSDIRTLEDVGSKIDQVRPVRYKSTLPDPSGFDDREHIGFIAEELDNVFPEFVEYGEDGVTPITINYPQITSILMREIQSLRQRLSDAGIP